MIKTLIVEDDPMAQKLLETFINESDNYEVVGLLSSAGFVETFCLKNSVDLILMDVCTNLGISGLEIAKVIKDKFPHIKIIIITSQPEYDFINRAKKAKVDSFWYKNPNREELLDLLNKTMNNENVYPKNTPNIKIGFASSNDFTLRQLEILRELTSGDTNKEIALRLGISANTVRDHIQEMLDMTGLQNRTSLAVAADKSGIVNINY